MLTLPNSLFERILRYLGIFKRCNIINHSNCNIKIINDILVKHGEKEVIYFSGRKFTISVYIHINNNWHVLYENREFDSKYDINIYDSEIDIAKRNRIVEV